MLDVKISALNNIDQLRNDWINLESLSDCSFFLTWKWIGSWLSTIKQTETLKVIRIEKENSLIGLCVAGTHKKNIANLFTINSYLVNQYGIQAFDAPTIEHNGLLLKNGHENEALQALYKHIQSPEFTADKLSFNLVNEDTKTLLANNARLVKIDTIESTADYFIDLDHFSKDITYLSSLQKSLRYEISRAMRIYEHNYGSISLTQASSTQQAIEYFKDMLRLHCRYWTRKTGYTDLQTPFMQEFHNNLITASFPDGNIHLLKITAGEYIIGYLYNFYYQGSSYAYQSGFDYPDDNRLKPGLVSHTLAITSAIESGAKRYDFLAGDHLYKKRLSTNSDTMYCLEISRGSFKMKILSLGRTILRK